MLQLIDKQVNFTNKINNYFTDLKNVVDCINVDQIQIVIEQIIEAYHKERFIYVFGNGGSASTASHLVADFNKGISCNLEKKFRVLCLNDNIPIMLAISNDIHPHFIFKHQLENFLQREDLVIAISGSGNSTNVIEAIEYANTKGANTVGLVGFDGGKLKKIAKHSIHVPVHDMQQVEDLHLAIQHLIARVLVDHLSGARNF
jgi:D-sedoheptulose 7-phosphate isomerase